MSENVINKVAPADLALHESEAIETTDNNKLGVKSNQSVFGTPLETRKHQANFC